MPYTPVVELGDCDLGRIIPDYAQPENIGVNMRTLGIVAARGGFYPEAITIRCVEGETSSDTPTVVGHDGQGNLLAGAVASKATALGAGKPEKTDRDWRVRSPLTLQINRSELFQRVEHSGPVRDPANWATHINAALAEGLRDATWRNVVSRPFPRAETLLASTGWMGSIVMGMVATGRPELAAMMSLFVTSMNTNTIRTLDMITNKKPIRDMCYSLIPAVHYDRVAVVGGLSRLLRFAKASSASSASLADS